MTTMQENLKQHAEYVARISVAAMTKAEREVRAFLLLEITTAVAEKPDYTVAWTMAQSARVMRACFLDYMSWEDVRSVIRQDGHIAAGLLDDFEGEPLLALVRFATDQLVDDHGYVQGGEYAQERAGLR